MYCLMVYILYVVFSIILNDMIMHPIDTRYNIDNGISCINDNASTIMVRIYMNTNYECLLVITVEFFQNQNF